MNDKFPKKIILNGDDFGYSKGVNRGIYEAIEHGVLTSTSIMINRPVAKEAKRLAKYKHISIGIHLDLTEEGIKRWLKIGEILTWSSARITNEFNKQMNAFQKIVGRMPDHIDSHHHIHRLTKFRSIVEKYSNQNSIPVRSINATFVTKFYGRSLSKWNDPRCVTQERLITAIENLPKGIHEIMCHPGYVDAGLVKSGTTYLKQREYELKALTSPKVKNYLSNNSSIRLISWKEVI